MITLLESAFTNNLGFTVASSNSNIRKDAYWFGEAQSRVVVSVSAAKVAAFESKLQEQNLVFEKLGTVSATEVKVETENWGTISDWKEKYDNAIESFLNK